MSANEWYKKLDPILERVNAKDSVYNEDTKTFTTNVYGKEYSFRLNSDRVEVSRGDLRNYFLLSEISSINHISMPYIKVVFPPSGKYIFAEQNASDVDMRLYLVMPGDICIIEEMVIFVNAGTQRSKNFIQAR